VYIFFGYYLVFRPDKILQGLKAWKGILSLSQFLKDYQASLALKTWSYRKKMTYKTGSRCMYRKKL
jgi:hypothetical protein